MRRLQMAKMVEKSYHATMKLVRSILLGAKVLSRC